MRLLHVFRLGAVGVVLCLLLNNVVGKRLDPNPSEAWKLKFASSINWQQITPFGNLVVSTNDGLYGIDPEKGRITWQIKRLGNIPADSYQVLPNTFYAQISLANQVIILDPYEGKILSDTKKAGFTSVIAKNVLFESRTILICGYKEKLKTSFSLFDIATGKELWNNGEFFTGSGGLGEVMNSLKVTQASPENHEVAAFNLIEAGGQGFIMVNSQGIFNINTQTGQLIWKAELPEPEGVVSDSSKSRLIRSASGAYFYYLKSGYLMGYDVIDGRQLWPEVVNINGPDNEIISHQKGLIILPGIDTLNTMSKTNIHLVDYQTGQTLWGKRNLWNKKAGGIDVPGAVVNIGRIDNDFLLTMTKGDVSYLNILDTDHGKLKFEHSLPINGRLEYTEMTNSGLLYITRPGPENSGEINIFDLKTGQPKLAKSIKSGIMAGKTKYKADRFRLLRVFKKNFLYVFSSEERTLYEVNLDNAQLRILREKITFEGEETPTHVEVRNDGLLLNSAQNIALIGFDGQMRFQKYYPPPDQPGTLRAFHNMNAVLDALCRPPAQMAGAVPGQPIAQSENNLEKGNQALINNTYDSQRQKARAYSPAAMIAAQRRFKASTRSSDFIFMLVSLEKQNTSAPGSQGGLNYGLVRVSKDTGEIFETIRMRCEKEPSYQVDDILNAIYYRQNPKEIVSYKFH
ncbi:MAG: PQQ-binding-like beta-propeller repeat protein [Cytophagales bacterium]|nr:PQQ-binding-like beta-propeller repeat protein [Cytophagales bacterium]